MAYMRASRCPECMGRLVFETVGTYGDIFDLLVKTGRPSNKRKARVHYEHNGEDSMVYCCDCGENYRWKQDSAGVIYIDYDEEAE